MYIYVGTAWRLNGHNPGLKGFRCVQLHNVWWQQIPIPYCSWEKGHLSGVNTTGFYLKSYVPLKTCKDIVHMICTIKNEHPLPRIDDSLELLGGNSYFSTLDICSWYWQVETGNPKTAFATRHGLQFRAMPFWVTSAPPTLNGL
jgi:hypothetical protein